MSEPFATVKAKITSVTDTEARAWSPTTRAEITGIDRTLGLEILRSEQPLLSTAPYGSMDISFRHPKNGNHPLGDYTVGDVLEFDIRKSD